MDLTSETEMRSMGKQSPLRGAWPADGLLSVSSCKPSAVSRRIVPDFDCNSHEGVVTG